MGYYDQVLVLSVFLNSISISAILFILFRVRAFSPTKADSSITKPTAVKASYHGFDAASETQIGFYGSTNRGEEKPNHHVVDDAYVRIYQRYNKKLYRWEEFTPSTRESEPSYHDALIFMVYYRYSEPTAIREFETLIEVKSETLTQVLRRCMKIVDSKMVHAAPGWDGQYYDDTTGSRDRVQVTSSVEEY